VIFGLEFPAIEQLVEWPNAFGEEGVWYGFNKIALINLVALVATSLVFILAARRKTLVDGTLVPRGPRNLIESAVSFIRDGIIMETVGADGLRYLPYLTSLFFFILIGNIFEVIPFFHMPANARMAGPAVLALLTWVYFIAVGLKHQGFKYFWNSVAPPGVPKALLPLVIPIELLSTFIVRPFSLAVRLFANMLAGHILLVTFSVLCITLFSASLLVLVLPFSFAMLVGLTGFEIMVAFLQAYIFTILAAVYIGSSMHAEH
jgi:F-type H+-transporting ATPase subunit a